MFFAFSIMCNFFALFQCFPEPINEPNASSGCQIDIKQLPERHPLFLNTHSGAIIYPDIGDSIINLNIRTTIELDCPGAGHIQVGTVLIEASTVATCVSGWDFSVLGKSVNISTIVCSSRITSVARYTGKKCWGANKEIEIGFQIAKGKFLQEITVCFDDIQRNVLYSAFLLTKQIGSQTTGNSRPAWTEGNFYNLGIRLNSLYPNVVHRITINRQVGLPDNDTKYVKPTGHYYIAKGHLTARSDFTYNAQQQATFHYINSVPQWQTFNGYNWFYFERSLRVYASNNLVDLVVYRGPYGILKLPHEKTGKDVVLFFYTDENGNNAMPIPELFWKIAYDPKHKAGVAVLGINNPYETKMNKTIICKDIADQLTWLTFDRYNMDAGYIYACTIDTFRKFIPDIPGLDVTKLLN